MSAEDEDEPRKDIYPTAPDLGQAGEGTDLSNANEEQKDIGPGKGKGKGKGKNILTGR